MHTMARPLSDSLPTTDRLLASGFPSPRVHVGDVWVHARCDGKLRGCVSTVDNLQMDCMMGMPLPLSMRRRAGRTARDERRGLEGPEGQRKAYVGVRYGVPVVAASGPTG